MRLPAGTDRSKELSAGLGGFHLAGLIQGADLDDLVRAKGGALAEEGRAAVGAKVRHNLVAAVGCLGEGLGATGLEALAVHNIVDRVRAAGDLATVNAVA